MNFVNKLERKFGKYAIRGLIKYIIGGYVIGIVLYWLGSMLTGNPYTILSYISLEPYYILHGQLWRLVSWLLIPESTGILALIMLYFYFYVGNVLESYWGSFRFNLYILGGVLFTVIAAFILYGILLATGNSAFLGFTFGTEYINLTMFLAMAVCFPDMEVRLYFLIPVKMKWLAVIYLALTGYNFAISNWYGRTVILASMLNFVIFYFSTKNLKRYTPHEIHRRKSFKRAATPPSPSAGPRYKCSVCGRTEKDDPGLTFRYCSKCQGNHVYCQDHLFTHEHIKF